MVTGQFKFSNGRGYTYLDGASEFSVEEDLDGVVPDVKVHLAKVERDCRIFNLSMDMTNHESGTPIELGCSCKDVLAAAHKQCAEAWFKIKGNKDQCAHLLIPLNKCRKAEFYLPWKCENERHSYEKCEYELVMERML
ncbi:Zinc finger, RING-CH-type [Sesbania bispinosa]|nr:Zinc finger, RING-CH-type [Sesbania bispinosa]